MPWLPWHDNCLTAGFDLMSTWQIAVLVSVLLQSAWAGCPNNCFQNGYCTINDVCICFKGRNGMPAWTGFDCSERTCPYGVSWAGPVVNANDAHPLVECSNKGLCDRKLAVCNCETNYEGLACERTVCLNQCSNNGECLTLKQYAADFGREYATPWDATKQVGCVCDLGWRGRDCSESKPSV